MSLKRCTTIAQALEHAETVTEILLRAEEWNENIAQLSACSKLKKLVVNFKSVTSIPDAIGELTQLTELDLANNQLATLPESMQNLKKLKKLVLDINRLSELPVWLSKLPKLTQLELGENRFSAFPEVLFSMPQLQKLNLSGTMSQYMELGKPEDWPFARLDPRLYQLTRLTHLSLYSTRLQEIPEGIGQLSKLKSLDLSYNFLTELPEEMGELQALTALKLEGNVLEELPASLGQLSKLKTLKVAQNSLETVPASILRLPDLSNASRKALEACAGIEKPEFSPEWKLYAPTLYNLLGEEKMAFLVTYLKREVTLCNHGSEEYEGWLATVAGKEAGVSAGQLFEAVSNDLPDGCACVLKDNLN
jgi:Leucine-rich repeat (LRR) protein